MNTLSYNNNIEISYLVTAWVFKEQKETRIFERHLSTFYIVWLRQSKSCIGTFDNGLYKIDDSGQTWDSIGMEKEKDNSIDIFSTTRWYQFQQALGLKNTFNTVYLGTEPIAFYRSDDEGESWKRMWIWLSVTATHTYAVWSPQQSCLS